MVENDKENWVWIVVFCDDRETDYRRIELREKTEKNRICWRFHTCGYGNNTTEAEHPFYASEENALDAHGFVAARMLDMDYQAVSVSGICVMRNSGAENPYNILGMDELYIYVDRPYEEHYGKKQFTEWNFKENPQDYIVINLGTNDQGGIKNAKNSEAEQQNFRIKYRKFIETVRKKNGRKTKIICALGSMDETLFPVICEIVADYQKVTGNMDISCFCYRHMEPEDGCGACGHPTKRTHEKMAEEIVTYIKKLDDARCKA